jgi:hypothetical protein
MIIRLVFWLALIPGVISVLVLIIGVHEPPQERKATQAPLKFGDLRIMGRTYRIVVCVGAVLTLARFSEAFLILWAQNLGLPSVLAPLVHAMHCPPIRRLAHFRITSTAKSCWA